LRINLPEEEMKKYSELFLDKIKKESPYVFFYTHVLKG